MGHLLYISLTFILLSLLLPLKVTRFPLANTLLMYTFVVHIIIDLIVLNCIFCDFDVVLIFFKETKIIHLFVIHYPKRIAFT